MDPDEIEGERRAEERRWKKSKPGDPDLIAKRNALKAEMRQLLRGTLEELEAAMRIYGFSEGSDEWKAVIAIWRAARGSGW